MGREVRRVPRGWEHPKDGHGRYKPLLKPSYEVDAKEFMVMAARQGLQAAVEYFGQAPDKDDYMPDWPDSECTMLVMYENVSEGTPISPAFETAEELARWLADNKASAFAGMTATYEEWLAMIGRGSAVSCVIDKDGMRPGVSA